MLLVTAAEGKVQLVAGLSPDLVARGLHAGNWLKEVAPIVGGGGGGRPDLAQAGGKNSGEDPRRPRAGPEVDRKPICRAVTIGLMNRRGLA